MFKLFSFYGRFVNLPTCRFVPFPCLFAFLCTGKHNTFNSKAMTNKRNGLTEENPINTTPDNSTTRANMNPTTASSQYTHNNDDDNINSPISPSPNPSPSDDDIDENSLL